ncbi:MAG: tetratricopeptide repeat protein [Myxococcales bacterium]|nr:tetratricopeptide repeat protein [Myxococcales bacterium]
MGALGPGCFRGPSTADIDRSRRELELAAALHEEQNIPGAIGHLRQALELDPGNAEAHLLMAVIQAQRGNTPSAEEHARQGVDTLVREDRRGATLAEARNVLGNILLARGKFEEATTTLYAAASDEMNTAPHLAWGTLGRAYLEWGRPGEAIEPLRNATQIQPRFCVGYHFLGRALFELDRLRDAEEALVQALEADPSCSDAPQLQNAWRLRGEVRARLGRRTDAIADLERCAALAPDTADGRACQRLLDSVPEGTPAPSEALDE